MNLSKLIILISVFYFKVFETNGESSFDFQGKKININLKNFHTLEICKPDYKIDTNINSTQQEVNTVNPTSEEEKNYREYLFNKLRKNGISRSTSKLITENAKYIQKSIQKRNEQPEFTKTFQYYRDQIYKINDKDTIKNITDFYIKNKDVIDEIEEIFKVDKEILLTICYMETRLGKITGSTRLIDAFFTMGVKNVRKTFFETSMIHFAKLVDFGILNFDTKGSWDGGYGYTQFMPESIIKYGISYQKDHKIDLLTVADSFSSTAHYLFEKGWHYKGNPILKTKTKANIHKCLIGFNKTNNIKNWQEVNDFDNIKMDYSKIEENEHLTLIMPDLRNSFVEKKDVFIGFDNFKVILTYNKSIFYATTASLLYDKLKQELSEKT